MNIENRKKLGLSTTVIAILVIIIIAAIAGVYLLMQTPMTTTSTSTSTSTITQSTSTSSSISYSSTTTASLTTSPTTTSTTASTSTSTTSTPSTTTSTTTPSTTTSSTTAYSTTSTSTTTTSTTTQSIKGMEFNSTVDFVKTFSHAKVDMTTVNGSDVQTTSISFTVEGREAIQGHDTIKVNMTIESGSSSSYEIWIGESDGVVYRLQMEGQTYEYPMSSQIGSGLLGVFNIFVAYSQSLGSFQYQITGNTIVGFTEGWTVVSSEYTTWGIGGKTFPAYRIKVTNVAHPEVDMQSMEVTLANLLADRWFYVNIFFQAKNGMTFEETISELTLST